MNFQLLFGVVPKILRREGHISKPIFCGFQSYFNTGQFGAIDLSPQTDNTQTEVKDVIIFRV